MTDDMQPLDELGGIEHTLRDELHRTLVPFDEARADEMIEAATRAQVRRLPRLAAPLGTAAAVLAVGAGVAVFAANGTGDNAAPAGGHPSTGRHPSSSTVLCVHALAALPSRVWPAPKPRSHWSPGTRISDHLKAGSAPASARPTTARVKPYQSTLRCTSRAVLQGTAACFAYRPLPNRLSASQLPRHAVCQMLPGSMIARARSVSHGPVVPLIPSPHRVHVPMPRNFTPPPTGTPPPATASPPAATPSPPAATASPPGS